ncbi:unnamed protein product [Nezara viridula]|uniref:Mitochondrial ribosomal protein S28 n=1 Tax=Nezara viridula TaxID=85310 RepID=A0A9P0MWY8_NEZVI|nr:unnamed protein product [Nezara viridula]
MSLQLTRLVSRTKNIVSFPYSQKIFRRLDSTKATTDENEQKNLGGFAKAFIKHAHVNDPEVDAPFATLLRNSKFIDLGDPEGRIVTGTVFHVVDDDLYVDFGWKFHCVCKRPLKNGSDYVLGSKVRLRVKDLELSTKFLGSEKDLTILEADAQLLGLVYSPAKST